MANTPSIIPTGAIEQASLGNPALRTLLNQIIKAANTQATQTSTSGKQPPNQSTATVTYQNPFYIVTFTDPGGASGLSPAQVAQQAAAASLGANPNQSVIYHQVQAATSVLFDAPSGLTTFGGDSGSLQTQFVCSGLATTHSWYFRIRTSYDGQNWNEWKLLSTKGTSVNANAVSLDPLNGGQAAVITLPGSQVVAIGVGTVASGGEVQTGGGTLLADTIGISAPASYIDGDAPTIGISANNINSLGVATLQYDGYNQPGWTGNLNFLTFGFAANGAQNLAQTQLGDGGRWVIMTVAGGCRIAFGAGTIASGATIEVPAGFTVANTLGVVTPAVTNETGGYLHGVRQSNMVAGVCTCGFDGVDGESVSSCNWFALAFEAPLAGNLVAVTDGQYLRVPTSSGQVMIGVGQTHSGGILPLPAGYNYAQCLAFSTPGTNDSTESGVTMHGIEVCNIDAGNTDSVGTVTMLYTNGGPIWEGAANWLAVAWI